MSSDEYTFVTFTYPSQNPQPLRQDATLSDEERLLQWQLFQCLACAAKHENKTQAEQIMIEASRHAVQLNLYTTGFAELFASVGLHHVWRFDNSEYSSYQQFVDDLPMVLPGARIVAPPKNHRLRPDFFVERDGLISCVEIKRGAFTNTAVKQLKSYMEAFDLLTGYAVAPKLTGTLLPGMMFIQWST